MSQQPNPLADLVDRARDGDDQALVELKRALGFNVTGDASAALWGVAEPETPCPTKPESHNREGVRP